MRPQNGSGSRRPRRSPRYQRRGGEFAAERTTKAPQKKSLWEKILGFFTGEKAQPERKPYPTYTPRDQAASEPRPQREAREPREQREPRESRKPEMVEVTSPKLYVGNLSFDATESDLFELFKGFGEVRNAEVVSNRHTQKSKGFAFVTMQTVEDAKRAVEELHDKEFMGRKLVVSGAKTTDVQQSENRDAA
jgi:RNA recognition motif-containing protein